MSCNVSDAVEIELPRHTSADRVATVLAIASTLVCAWAALPVVGPAVGLALPAILAVLLLTGRRQETKVILSWSRTGELRLRESGGRVLESPFGGRTRLLGPMAVLDARPAGLDRSLWLLPGDLPPGRHRSLRAHLAAGH